MSEVPQWWVTLPYVLSPAQPPSAGPHIPQVPYQHIPSTQQQLLRLFQHQPQAQVTPLPPSPTPSPHLESSAAAGLHPQKVALGSRRDTVFQGAKGERLGQDLGLSCTEYSSQGRSDGAQMCEKHLDVCAGCSWNDNQVVWYSFHLRTAATLRGFPVSVENGKSGKSDVNHKDKDYCNINYVYIFGC